jgi:hypothetical protein
MSGNNIKVVCRFRPQNSLEIREGGVPIVEITDGVAVQLKVRFSSCDAPVLSYFIPRLTTLAACFFRAEKLKTRLPLIRSLAWKPSSKKFLSILSSPLSMVSFHILAISICYDRKPLLLMFILSATIFRCCCWLQWNCLCLWPDWIW